MEVKDVSFEKFYENFLKGLKRKHPINLHDALWYGFEAGFNAACEELYELDDDTVDIGNYRDLAWPQEDKFEYENGFEEGYDEGYEEGNEDGYENGYEDGFEKGCAESKTSTDCCRADDRNGFVLNKDTLYEAFKQVFGTKK